MIMSKKIILYLITMCLFLGCLYFTSPWYPDATLHVKGNVPDASSQIAVRWNGGAGLNGYELRHFNLQPLPDFTENEGINLKITRTGEKHPAAAGSLVYLRSVKVDGLEQLGDLELPQDAEFDEGVVKVNSKKAIIDFKVKPENHLRIVFLAFNYAGEVEIDIDGTISNYNLYSSNSENKWSRENVVIIDYWFVSESGDYAVSMKLPRYNVKTYRIESKKDFLISSVTIRNEFGETFPVTQGGEVKTKYSPGLGSIGANFPMTDLNSNLKRLFSFPRFFVQIVSAVITSWIMFGIVSFVFSIGGWKDLLFRERRYLFWGMLVSGSGVFFLWHFVFWPGIMSTDSLKIWRAAQIPGLFLGDHPPLNVFLYEYLSYFWNNPAVVPLFQNVITSLLTAYIFFKLYRWGLPLFILIPGYLIIIFSIPIGLYNAVMWKDIPYAVLVVFLGFRIADLSFQKRYGSVGWSAQEWLVFVLLVLALPGLRHNGALYLVIVPAMLIISGVFKIKKKLIYGSILTIFMTCITLGTIQYLRPSTDSYFVNQTSHYLHKTWKKVAPHSIKSAASNYMEVLNVNQKGMQWDHVHLTLYGRYNYDFLKKTGWSDIYPYIPFRRSSVQETAADILKWMYDKSYQRPWVYLSWNPFYLLLLMPLIPLLAYKLHMTSVFSLFVLSQVAVLVILEIFNWRYYYFFYLSLFFIIPMIVSDFTREKMVEESCSSV